MGYIDSHAHLTDGALYKDTAAIVAGFSRSDISRVMLICCDDEDYRRAKKLKADYNCFDIAKGYCPQDADNYHEEDLIRLEEQLSEKAIDMIGEIGLDYYRVKDNKDKQRRMFIAQIEIAERNGLAISVHSREAACDTYDILMEYHHSRRGVLHCYSGSCEMMERYVTQGYYFSIAGPVTFNNAAKLQEVVRRLSLEHLLYETDCPYLTPMPFRGKRNDPNYIKYTAAKIAELKKITVPQLNAAVELNYKRLLGRADG